MGNSDKTFATMKALGRIFVLLGLLFPSSTVFAQAGGEAMTRLVPAAATPCANLDVVFLIDQSSSMGGEAGALPNDPTNQREYAPEAMIDLLSDIALDQCPDAHHRLGLISYGTDAQIDLPLSDIAPDTFAEAEALRRTLKGPVQALALRQTDPLDAFALAIEMLNDASPVGEGIRKRVIIFITDGQPCVDKAPYGECGPSFNFLSYTTDLVNTVNASLPFQPTLLQQEACLTALRARYPDEQLPEAEVNACLDDFRVAPEDYLASTYIYAIMLNAGTAYSQRLREMYIELAQSHAGELIDLSENRNDIPTTFNRILTQLAGVEATRLTCGRFAVNPYLERVKIVLYKINPEVVVRLTYTDYSGSEHALAGGIPSEADAFQVAEYNAYGANERYELLNPYPGIWTLEADNCDGFDAFYSPIVLDTTGSPIAVPEIAQYDREPFYDPEGPVYLTYQMRDQAGNLLGQADHPQFHINFEVAVTAPDGQAWSYNVVWDSAGQVFRASEPLQVPVPGVYRVDLSGTTFEHVGEPSPVADNYAEVFSAERELFRHEGLEFRVFPVYPVVVRIVSPQPGQQLKPIHGTLREGWPLPVNPIFIEAQLALRDGGSLPADMSEVLTDAPTALEAVVVAGESQSDRIVLQLDPAVSGRYVGQIAGFEGEGAQRLMVQLVSGLTAAYRPETREASVEFSRVDEALNRAQTYYVLLAALGALAMVVSAYGLRITSNKVAGTLGFLDANTPIAEFGLSSGRNWKVIGARQLKAYPHIGLRRLTVHNRGRAARGRRGRARPNGLEADPLLQTASGHPGVRVAFVPLRGRRYSLDLDPGIPVEYDNASGFRVVYNPPDRG